MGFQWFVDRYTKMRAQLFGVLANFYTGVGLRLGVPILYTTIEFIA